MIAELHLQTGLRDNCTYLQSAYYTPPFKIADITESKRQKELQLMVMSSSPGILDGDDYRIKIDVAPNSNLQLQTQSYQHLFQMKGGAKQTIDVHLGEGSSFCFLPHPVVPHAGSIYSAKNQLFFSQGCTLIWGEVITCGRKLSGEVFRFSSFHNCTEIFWNNRLVVKENLLLKPAVTNVHSIGQMEGYTHQVSFLYLNEEAAIALFIQNIFEDLMLQEDIAYGISALPVNGLVVRLLGYKAEQLHLLLNRIAKCTTQQPAQTKQPIEITKEEVYVG